MAKTKQTAWKSTGVKATRMELASKAARKTILFSNQSDAMLIARDRVRKFVPFSSTRTNPDDEFNYDSTNTSNRDEA